MKITRAVVPSLFTVLNIFCGFLSLVHTDQGDFRVASWFIILAALFDTFDGIMARITKSSSNFGVQFDSLSDVVSFGVAPSFLVYTVTLRGQQDLGVLLSAMPLIFGALRLARFNSQLVGFDKDFFKGLPIPATAVTISSFVLNYYSEETGLHGLEASVLTPMVVLLSLLMVSTIRYDAVPKFSRRGINHHPFRFTIGIVGVTAIVLTRGSALFPFFAFYVATGPIRTFVQFVQHAMRPAEKTADEKDAEVTRIDL